MSGSDYSSRRIFKSTVTSQNVIRELLQIICLAEALEPSGEVWFVSPWISDFVLLDNRSGGFNSVNPQWHGREIRLTDLALQLMTGGTRITVVTRPDGHNRTFLDKMQDVANEAGLGKLLTLIVRDNLHTKGIVSDSGLLLGSMNLTYNGLELNDEYVQYDTVPENIAKARLEFEFYKEGSRS